MRNLPRLMMAMLLAPLTAMPVLAQDASGGLEEILVTAQRREQNLQEVPISITAFSGEALAKANIRSAADYLNQTPNVSYTEDGQTGARGIGISMRGIGTMVSGENAFINTIGVYLDEFSVVSVPNQVANPELPDMERVEILRGPQGTYFGRNAVGGALNLTTKRPTDEFGGEVRTGYENYEGGNDSWNATAILNVPVSENFRVRGVVWYENSDGYVNNICARGANVADCPGAVENGATPNGVPDSGHETKFFRFSADWDISDRTSVKTTFFRTDEQQGTDESVPSGVLDIDSSDTFGISFAEDPGTGFWPDNQNQQSHDRDEHTDNKSTVAILNISHQFNDAVVLKSVTGIIDASMDRFFDNDVVGGMDALVRTNAYDGKSWSTELRLEITQDRFDFVAGLLYANDEQTQNNNVAVSSNSTATINGVGVFPPFPEGLGLLLSHKEFEVKSKAVFIDYTLHVNDQLDLTAGARYTDDEVSNDLLGFGIAPTCCFEEGGFAFFQSFVNIPRPPVHTSNDFDDVTPRFVASYQVNEDLNVYGTISKGYKAGGASVGNNIGGGQVVPVDGAALGAEAEAVVLYLEKGDAVAGPGQRLVQDEDGGLDAGIGLEHAGRQGDHGDQVLLHQHFAQLRIGALALEDDALGHDDAGASAGRQVLGHVVHEQHLAALALHAEAVVRPDAALGRHEGWVGEDDVGGFVPALLAGEQMIKAKQLQDGRVDVVGVDWIFHGLQADFVGLPVAVAMLETAAREPLGIAPWIVIAAIAALAVGSAAKFGGPNNKRVIE